MATRRPPTGPEREVTHRSEKGSAAGRGRTGSPNVSSTPIYDELAATYLADLIPAPGDAGGPDQPGEQASPAAPSADRPPAHTRPKV